MAEFWELFAQVIRAGLNVDEPRMSLAEGERRQPLHMVRPHRAKGSLHLRLEAVAVRASRLRPAPYVLRRSR